MKINQEHKYHGAVLNQIAEHGSFSAVNAIKVNGRNHRSAFKINNEIVVYLKYASAPHGDSDCYRFNFNREHLDSLCEIALRNGSVFLALVCVEGEEICGFSYDLFEEMIEQRKKEVDAVADQQILMVQLEAGRSFRVYMSGGRGRTIPTEPYVIRRNACPNRFFSE